MAPCCGVVDVSTEEPGHGWRGKKEHFVAAVVAACEAGFAFTADDVGFDGDAVAYFEGGYGGADCCDGSSRFVAKTGQMKC